jgi:hypothetical protein
VRHVAKKAARVTFSGSPNRKPSHIAHMKPGAHTSKVFAEHYAWRKKMGRKDPHG